MNSRTLRIALPVAVIALVVLGYAGYQYFIVADSPDEVTTESALEQLTEDLAAEEPAAEDAEASDGVSADESTDEVAAADPADAGDGSAAPAGVDGTWVIDDDFGDFAFENASGSFAGFRVDKELFVGGVQVAVGRSGDVTGTIVITDGAVTGGEIVVDTTAMESDIGARASAIRGAINTGDFPTATFAITESAALDTNALEAGDTVTADIAGDLTINGVTNAVTVSAEATVVEPGLALIVGGADLTWADFEVATPNSSAGTVADEGVLEVQLVVRLG